MSDEYRSLFELAPDAITVAGLDRRHVDCNEAACLLFGYSREELLGTRVDDLVDPDALPVDPVRLERLIGGNAVYKVRSLRRKDGGTFLGEVSSRLLPDGRALAIIRELDTDRLRAAHDEALEARVSVERLESLARLAGGVAHDFNNLFTVVAAQAELAQGGVDVPASLDAILEAVARGAELTAQLLTFTRQRAEGAEAHDLHALVRESLPMLRRVLGETVPIELDLSASAPHVRASRPAFEQVLGILAKNAKDASPRGGRVTLATRDASDESVLVSICDDGLGMSPEVRAHAFEPFFTTKPRPLGRGLGLSIVLGFARRAGGNVRLLSEAGEGTTVELTLPRTDAAPAKSAPPRPAREAPRAGGRVLFAEDDDAVRRTTARILRMAGFEVVEANSGQDALDRYLEDEAFDLLLTDVVMPGMDGVELAKTLLRRRPELPIVLVSGYTADLLDRASLPARVRLVGKPFRPDELLGALSQALGQAALTL
ncbi:MAG TPA: hypothetical protein DEF51_56305 [Myxococcales bacterium]|nr:hypothetical protein [Myxococcales bacterium]